MRLLRSILTGAMWAATAGLPAIAQTPSSTGTRQILSLSFASATGDLAAVGVQPLVGGFSVAERSGQRMLKATAASEFLIRLPERLPTDFTLEFDLIPKGSAAPGDDLAVEGTGQLSESSSSAHLFWHPNTLRVRGGGVEYQARMPADLAEGVRGTLTRIVATFEGETVKLYTNGRRLYTLIERRFARGSVLRVFMGGQGDGDDAVYLARLRVLAGVAAPAPLTVVTTMAPAGTITPMAAPPPPPPERISTPGELVPSRPATVQVVGNGPAPTDLAVSAGPTTAHLSWKSVPKAVSYKVFRGLVGSMSATELTSKPWANSTTQLMGVTDLVPDASRSYTYQVQAYQADGTYGSAKVDYTPSKPTDPTGLTGSSPLPGTVKLSWAGVWGAVQYLVTGPGVPANTTVSDPAFSVSSIPMGVHTYRVASVFASEGVMTASTSWPSVEVRVGPASNTSMLTLPNGRGSLAEYNLHACNAGKWLSTQQIWVNTWCDLPTSTSMAQVTGFPLLNLYGIQEFQPSQGSNIMTGARFDIFVNANEWTTFRHWRWGKDNLVVPEAAFEDVADLGRGRRVGCVQRGAGSSASTMCWALNTPGVLSIIVQSQQESSFLLFRDLMEDPMAPNPFGCPLPKDWWDMGWVCGKMVGQSSTTLDSRGDRFAPHACLACHGGRYDVATGKVIGATLLPLDPKGFKFSGDRSSQEETIRQLNMVVFTSNASPGVRDYITQMYGARQSVIGASVSDDFVPPGWASQPAVFKDVYRPYCASCHNAQSGSLGFRTWDDMVLEKVRVQRAICTGSMPHAEVPYARFWGGGASTPWPRQLLAALGYPPC